MGKIKEAMDKLHPKPEGLSPENLEKLVTRVKEREGKSGKQLVSEALEARHPTQDKEGKESTGVKLAKQKLEQGIPLSPKDRYAIGFDHLHESKEVKNGKE